ncbi:hypothetical protein HJC23_010352 [Cyclotella cryptica]|uniref:Uncharacterized protein n=1 Tax=Cyclotella cryptica TaxID=29204 RepID=A0ABD3NYI1_9STRA
MQRRVNGARGREASHRRRQSPANRGDVATVNSFHRRALNSALTLLPRRTLRMVHQGQSCDGFVSIRVGEIHCHEHSEQASVKLGYRVPERTIAMSF